MIDRIKWPDLPFEGVPIRLGPTERLMPRLSAASIHGHLGKLKVLKEFERFQQDAPPLFDGEFLEVTDRFNEVALLYIHKALARNYPSLTREQFDAEVENLQDIAPTFFKLAEMSELFAKVPPGEAAGRPSPSSTGTTSTAASSPSSSTAPAGPTARSESTSFPTSGNSSTPGASPNGIQAPA